MNEFYFIIVLRKKEEFILFCVLLKEFEDFGEFEIYCRVFFKIEFMVNFNFVGMLFV